MCPEQLTISEELFESYCRRQDIPFHRIPRSDGPTPDYSIVLRGKEVVCEVKELVENAEERAAFLEARREGGATIWIGNRLRQQLKDISRQLKASSRCGAPTLLVVFNASPIQEYTGRTLVLEAMFGQRTWSALVPSDRGRKPIAQGPFFGRGRGLSSDMNTSISAISVLKPDSSDREDLRQAPLILEIYHNPFARVLLEPRLLGGLAVREMLKVGATSIQV